MPEMDDYGQQEVPHMASFLSWAVASELSENAQVQAHPEWKALADSAAESSWALYQAVGATHLGDGDNIPKGQDLPILGLYPFVIDMHPRFLSVILGRRNEF